MRRTGHRLSSMSRRRLRGLRSPESRRRQLGMRLRRGPAAIGAARPVTTSSYAPAASAQGRRQPRRSASGSLDRSLPVLERREGALDRTVLSKRFQCSAGKSYSVSSRFLSVCRRACLASSLNRPGGLRERGDRIGTHVLKLGNRNQEFGCILDIINQLAEQTNILAPNATIRAIRSRIDARLAGAGTGKLCRQPPLDHRADQS